MAQGTLNGKVFSQKTIDVYKLYAESFIEKYGALSEATLEAALLKVPAANFAKRLKIYEALVSFAKYLIKENCLTPAFLESVKVMRPERHIPPKRSTVGVEALEKTLAACKTPMEKALVSLLSATGLRASELCALKWSDIDLVEGSLTVMCGKGGKMRRVGLSNAAVTTLVAYAESPKAIPSPNAYLFFSRVGKPMDRHGVYQRLERIGREAGVPVHPHALRRAFVTINANKGRSLVHLQRACGHSDIKTTMSYCRTTEQEVIDAMKEW